MTPPSPSPVASDRPLHVAVIGSGAIGGAVVEAIEKGRVPDAQLVSVLRSDSTDVEFDRAIAAADVVVEATTVAAAEEYIPRGHGRRQGHHRVLVRGLRPTRQSP